MSNFIARLVEAAREYVVSLPIFPPLLRPPKWLRDKDARQDDSGKAGKGSDSQEGG